MAKLFVGNLPHGSTEHDLAGWVTSQGISVRSAEVIRDRLTGNSRGFGFVLLEEQLDVAEAIRQLNGKRMEGRTLTVGEARPIVDRRPH